VSSTVIAFTVSAAFLAVTLSVVTGNWFWSATERAPSTCTAGKVGSAVCEKADDARQVKTAAAVGRNDPDMMGNLFIHIPYFLYIPRHPFLSRAQESKSLKSDGGKGRRYT
jgi:hypothetical protein